MILKKMDKKAMTWLTLLIMAVTVISLLAIVMFIWILTGHAPDIIETPFRIIKGALLGG